MSGPNYYLAYTLLSALLLAPSLWAKLTIKGIKFTPLKQYIALFYSLFPFMIHSYFISCDYLMMVGKNDDPWLKSSSTLLIIMHIYLTPAGAGIGIKNPQISPSSFTPYTHMHAMDPLPKKGNFLYFLGSFIMVFCCACTFTALTSFMLLAPLELDQKTNQVIIISIFIFLLTTFTYLHMDHYKKNGPTL